MRTFQFSDAKSHKFWNIDVQGNAFTVTYGKIGTAGQTQTKTFKDAATAQAEADKLVKEKTKKGYVETTPKASASEEDAFVSALQKNPHDLAGWCAFADLLAEKGDPRGEFMQTQIALEDEGRPKKERDALKKKEAALLKAHEKEWVGDWAELVEAPTDTEGRGQINHTGGKKYEFRRGVVAVANFGQPTVAASRAFVKSPQTKFVRELFVGDNGSYEEEFEPGPDVPEDADEDQAALHALLRWPFMKYIRRFQFGWISDEVYDNFCNFQCHLSGDRVYDFVKQMPDVEEVLIFAHFHEEVNKLAALPMPNLRVLQLYHGWNYPLDKLAKNASLTNLTHLLCHPHALEGGDDPYIRLAGLRAVCRSPHLRSLTHLRLRLTDFGDAGVREIIDSGVLKRLKMLDLRHGCITDEGAKLLAACPDLKNLERLDLSRNGLTEAGKNALLATKVPVSLEHQHAEVGDQEAYGDTPRYLFEGDYE
jgi:uncharacterized protein (TIGR02996 family)